LGAAALACAFLPIFAAALGMADAKWLLACCGVAVAAICWFLTGNLSRRAALASMAHVIWGGLSSRQKQLWERSRRGEEVAGMEIEEIERTQDTISALTRSEFGEADRKLVIAAEDECYVYFGVSPPPEKSPADPSLREAPAG